MQEELTSKRHKGRAQQQPQCQFGNAEREITAQYYAGQGTGKQQTEDMPIDRSDYPVPCSGDKRERYGVGDIRSNNSGHGQARIQNNQRDDTDGTGTNRRNGDDNPEDSADGHRHDYGTAVIKRRNLVTIKSHDGAAENRLPSPLCPPV